jgi:hypothetical protein
MTRWGVSYFQIEVFQPLSVFQPLHLTTGVLTDQCYIELGKPKFPASDSNSINNGWFGPCRGLRRRVQSDTFQSDIFRTLTIPYHVGCDKGFD